MRLTWGEMDFGDNTISKFEARTLLLDLIKEKVPEVLESLYNDVYPEYKRLRNEIEEAKTSSDKWRERYKRYGDRVIIAWNEKQIRDSVKNWDDIGVDFFYPDLVPLKEKLEKWAMQYNIRYNWIFEKALDTLDKWYQFPTLKKRKEWSYGGIAFWSIQLPYFEFTEKFTWDIFFETEGNFKERVREKFEECLERYVEECKKIAKEKGLKKAKIKRRRSSNDPTLHFKWFIDYRILGKDFGEIAEEFQNQDPQGKVEISEDAIRKSVKEVEELLGD
ncbi:MAG: hypothetical protein XD49_1895 [Caldanaerobacter subterraneus]|uniref:Uncharacterized protein n=2 Tax=Thermoanaerobacteraceae TaxID=186814 RepID=A0A117KVD8_9THEO|nr:MULTISPECIES: hypothetical protein [Thermoanaerobacteraceae]KUK08063.1 MAG: hypothetical protein XD49_1895 [Caldanaerobacter subterraneus]MDP9751829.1 hypothetical protein [Thermoanaerobacter pentosaceus]HBT48963.1 hypothetical protein [Caldanaerobacter subterraneus]